jgi:DNA integrity scanning protein DisA with diadenylate cyclase activity
MRDNPSSFPMVERYLKVMPKILREQQIIGCKVNAITTFITKYKEEFDQLTRDLESCNNLPLNEKNPEQI